jgi:hypothetical protein
MSNKKQRNRTVAYLKDNKSGKGRHLSVRETMGPGTYVINDPYENIDTLVGKGFITEEQAEGRKDKLKSANVFMIIEQVFED